MPTSVKARRYIVSGRVQGVGFRWFVREQARARGLAGFVQNTADGLVVAEVYGNADRLLTLEEALRQGPNGASVAQLEIIEMDVNAAASLPMPFEIRRLGDSFSA